jgi:16S rRNA (uracil1498-N3)-methyltransferase
VRRFRIRPEDVRGDRVTLSAEETRHLTRVLRLGMGDVVEALDGAGTMLTVRIERVDRRGAEAVVLARATHPTESPLRLTLAQSMAKGDKMESIIRMATELGATTVVPLATARTVVTIERGGGASRLARWRRVAQEAAKQSGRSVVPEVAPPQTLEAWLAARDATDVLVCLWEGAEAALVSRLPKPPVTHATLVVGPEGGLEPGEAQALEKAGAVVGNLGPRILRTETAGPVGLALLQERYGDLGGGPA